MEQVMEVSTYLGSVTRAWMTESFGTAIRAQYAKAGFVGHPLC